MTDTKPGADELRIQAILKQRGVGPDAEAPTVPPIPKRRPRDWLDNILDDNARSAAAPVEEPTIEPTAEAPAPAVQQAVKKKATKSGKAKARRRRGKSGRKRASAPGMARSAWDSDFRDPRQSLVDAWMGIPNRLKWLATHTAAALAGWRIGLVQWATDMAAWFAAGHWASPSAWVLYLLGVLAIALYRAVRHRGLLLAMWAAIPVSSVAVGVLLYGTGYHS